MRALVSRLLHRLIPWGLEPSEFRDLLLPGGHSAHIQRHRARLITSRVALVSALFAVLTPLWIIVDMMAFAWPTWGWLAVLRLGSAAAFGLLAVLHDRCRSLKSAYLLLTAMLAIPPLFFLASQPLLVTGAEAGFLTDVMTNAYSLLPFVVVAGLSVFPLTAAEVAIAAAPIIVILLQASARQAGAALEDVIGELWLMLLVVGIAAFSGMSQLHYMIALVNQATKDLLTDAFTRRSGEEALDLQFRIACRTSAPLAVAFIDIDRFKPINDTFGHEQGDAALKSVAADLKKALRRSDILVRWGGEEFLVILPNTNTEGALKVLRRIKANGFGLRPDGAPLTVSMGLAERIADDAPDWDALVERADARMYEVKRNGRNGCVGPEDTTLHRSLVDA